MWTCAALEAPVQLLVPASQLVERLCGGVSHTLSPSVSQSTFVGHWPPLPSPWKVWCRLKACPNSCVSVVPNFTYFACTTVPSASIPWAPSASNAKPATTSTGPFILPTTQML